MYWNLRQIAISQSAFRLTLTWDVLKCNGKIKVCSVLRWLTLTWDVLKWRNNIKVSFVRIRLTLTWDVLKWNGTFLF